MSEDSILEQCLIKGIALDDAILMFHKMCEKWPTIAIHHASKTLRGQRLIKQDAIQQLTDEYTTDITLGEVLRDVCDEIRDRNKEV